MTRMKLLNLDTAAEHDPSHSERELAKLMRELPTPLHVARALVRTPNGNLVQQVAR